jgi:hypothetical protein
MDRFAKPKEDSLFGKPRPPGYLRWYSWADIQYRGGLRQSRCPHGKWHFPQESCADGGESPCEVIA